MEDFELRKIMREQADLAVKNCLIALGYDKPFCSLRESYRLYGKSNVDSWIRSGLVRRQKDGQRNSKIRIDKMELESASKTSNRH